MTTDTIDRVRPDATSVLPVGAGSPSYGEMEGLLRLFLSPDVASALLARGELAGSLVEVSVLFADLQGFTAFSEGVEPAEVAEMLNRYLEVAVPCVLAEQGTVVQFVGDALLAVWGAPVRRDDHAVRAVRAGVAMQEVAGRVAAGRPGWPRFRVGVNSGRAWVGTIGSEVLRGFNVMGDAVNVAARLQELAAPGEVVVGEATARAAGGVVPVRLWGNVQVKGRRAPVRTYTVETGARSAGVAHAGGDAVDGGE